MDELSILCFSLGERWFGLDVHLVEEVVGEQTLTPVPGTPRHVLGLFPLHGRAIPLFDPACFLELPVGDTRGLAQAKRQDSVRVIVVSSGEMTVGILVDEVREIVEVPRDRLGKLRLSAEGKLVEFALAEVDLGQLVVTVLDLPRLLDAARV